jgi:hypothetical protein
MEVWCLKTADIPDLLFGHQNGERNEATQCVNESRISEAGEGRQKSEAQEFRPAMTESF